MDFDEVRRISIARGRPRCIDRTSIGVFMRLSSILVSFAVAAGCHDSASRSPDPTPTPTPAPKVVPAAPSAPTAQATAPSDPNARCCCYAMYSDPVAKTDENTYQMDSASLCKSIGGTCSPASKCKATEGTTSPLTKFEPLKIQIALSPDVEGHIVDNGIDRDHPTESVDVTLHFKKLDYKIVDPSGVKDWEQELICRAAKPAERTPVKTDNTTVVLHEADGHGWAEITSGKTSTGINYDVGCYRAATNILCQASLAPERWDAATKKQIAPASPAELEAGARSMIEVCKSIRPI